MSPGTPCRKRSGLCDLPEFCTGESPFCPPNSYQMDGAACDGGKAYCYSGMCLTYRDQCVQLWGPGKDTACSTTAGLSTSKCSAPATPHPAAPHPEKGRGAFHSCCQQQSLRSLFSCLTHVEEAAENFPCSNCSRKRMSEWLAWGEMKQPLECLPCRSTASTRCLL